MPLVIGTLFLVGTLVLGNEFLATSAVGAVVVGAGASRVSEPQNA